MTRRGGRMANDPGLNAVLDAEVPATCLVGKTWDFHVETAIKTTLEENLDMIRQSVAAARDRGRESMFDWNISLMATRTTMRFHVRAAHDAGRPG